MITEKIIELHSEPGHRFKHIFGLLLGTCFLLVSLFTPPPSGLSVEGWKVIGIILLMVTWWVTEALPLSVTSLMPLAMLPLLDVYGIKFAAAPYASPIIFLFIGGSLIGIALEKWGLHRRIALKIIKVTGLSPGRILAGFMIAAAFTSMWIANMTAVVMMLPIALAVAGVVVKERDKDPEIQKACKNFATSLLLGVTFAASIGGVSTLVGTVPNMIFKGYMEQSFGIEIGFIEWMKVGSLFMIIMLPIAWLILARVLFDCRKVKASGMAEEIKREISEIGSFSRQELTMLLVFLVTVFFWIGGSYLDEFFSAELDPTIIAVLASLLLFLLPSGLGSGSRMLDAEDVEKIPLSVILIFGGSLSVGGAMVETGVAEWVGEQLNYFSNYPQIMLILIIVILVCVVTEILSNVATIAAFLPIISALAIAVDINPIIFGVATTMAVSCSFMLPSSTPSNTVILAGGYVKISQMAKAGLLLNLFAIIVVTLIAHLVVPQVFDL